MQRPHHHACLRTGDSPPTRQPHGWHVPPVLWRLASGLGATPKGATCLFKVGSGLMRACVQFTKLHVHQRLATHEVGSGQLYCSFAAAAPTPPGWLRRRAQGVHRIRASQPSSPFKQAEASQRKGRASSNLPLAPSPCSRRTTTAKHLVFKTWQREAHPPQLPHQLPCTQGCWRLEHSRLDGLMCVAAGEMATGPAHHPRAAARQVIANWASKTSTSRSRKGCVARLPPGV